MESALKQVTTSARMAVARISIQKQRRAAQFSAARDEIATEIARGANERARIRACAVAADLDQTRIIDAIEPHLHLLSLENSDLSGEVIDALETVVWAAVRVTVQELTAIRNVALGSPRIALRVSREGRPVDYERADPERIMQSVLSGSSGTSPLAVRAAAAAPAAPAAAPVSPATAVEDPPPPYKACPQEQQQQQQAPLKSGSQGHIVLKKMGAVLRKLDEKLRPPTETRVVAPEALPLSLAPQRPDFGLGSRQAPVDEDLHDTLTLTNPTQEDVLFRLCLPPDSHRSIVRAEPCEGAVPAGQSVEIALALRVLCTTKTSITIQVTAWSGASAVLSFSAPVVVTLESQLTTRLDKDELPLFQPPVGNGTYGVVYRSDYRGLPVAVKVLRNQDNLNPQTLAEFNSEVAMMSKLRHPSIVNFLGAVHEPGCLALVTEYCAYGTLPNVMRQMRMPYALRLRCLMDVARGLDFLHRSGIMHRDLKPDNLLVVSLEPKSTSVCKLSDFGTTRDVNRYAENIQCTKGIGTPLYMSPEILSGAPYSYQCDIYSFALVMYYVLREIIPFSDEKEVVANPWEFANLVRQGKRPSVPSDWPTDFVALMNRCWCVPADNRPTFCEIVRSLDVMFRALDTSYRALPL